MKNRSGQEELLDAVWLDTPAHNASLHTVRRAARRRRWARYTRHAALAALVVGLCITWLQQPRTTEKPSQPPLIAREPSYFVRSEPLPAGMLVRTLPQLELLVTTMRDNLELFRATNPRPPEKIDDDTLLDLAPGAILVRHQSGPAELVMPENTSVASRAAAEN